MFINGIIICVVVSLSTAKMCHQNEIPDGLQALQYELEMIQTAEQECFTNKHLPRNESYCDQVFDGIMCWPSTPPGSISVQPCPSYMYNVLPNRNATKICMPNGQWFVHPEYNTTWTNLSECYDDTIHHGTSILVPKIIQDNLRYIQILYDVGYSISLVTLLVAVTIMLRLRNLRCQRNTVHINLFFSFILRSVICFIKDIYVIPEVNLVYHAAHDTQLPSFQQSVGCKIVYTLFYYILSTNFMWIFVEGIYMHTFVQSTKYNMSTALYRLLLVFGWGASFTFVIPWVIVRIQYENTLCWSTHDIDNNYHWIIKGPITVTVVINFLFFTNIIRLLYTKLTASYQVNPKRYRKLTKSTLILIPLFGVYYIVYIAVPMCMKPMLEVVWMYTEMFFNSFQGFAVAVLFCFMNEEVKKEIKKVFKKHQFNKNKYVSNRSRSRSITGYLYHSDHDINTVTDQKLSTGLELNDRKCTPCNIKNGLINNGTDKITMNGFQTDELHPMIV